MTWKPKYSAESSNFGQGEAPFVAGVRLDDWNGKTIQRETLERVIG